MTRFDATEPTARRALFVAAIDAHRERASEFLTLEPQAAPPSAGDELIPWIQFSDTTVSMDCTAAELDRLKTLLNEYPDFRIDELQSPEEAEGTHVRISSRSDANRLADFFEAIFQQVFTYPVDYRVWVAAV